MTTYFFCLRRNKNTVIKSTASTFELAEKKAKQWAKSQGLSLSKCNFTIDWLNFFGKIQYNILTLPKGFRAKNR
jgi:hypothetical protein